MNQKLRTALKVLLILFGSTVLLIFLFLVGIGAYMAYGSRKADAAAKAFCKTVKVGDDFNTVAAAATRTDYPNRMMSPEEGQTWFAFQGGIFHAATCKVGVKDSKVTSARFAVDDY
jgi:hypothetical protein